MIDTKATQKVFAICQLEKVLILSEKDLVPQLCGILKRHPYRRQKNRGGQIVA